MFTLESIVSPRRNGEILFFFFNDTATTEIYTLSPHDALPIYGAGRADLDHRKLHPLPAGRRRLPLGGVHPAGNARSEEHTSELQSQSNLVCRLLLEKKKKTRKCCSHHLNR